MSSHREAPEISKDPVADNTDLYAFVSPDSPDTVTLISQLHPAGDAGRRPELLRVRRRRPLRDPHRQRRRRRRRHHATSSSSRPTSRNPDTFLYNTGPIDSLDSPNWNRRQTYTVTKIVGRGKATGARRKISPARRATSARAPRPTTRRWPTRPSTRWTDGDTVFAGQRRDGFYVDLGSIFDLGDLRPFQNLHLIPTPRRRASTPRRLKRAHHRHPGPDQAELTRDGTTPDGSGRRARRSIGVWARRAGSKVQLIRDDDGNGRRRVRTVGAGLAARQPAVQRGRSSRWARRTTGTRAQPERRRRSS